MNIELDHIFVLTDAGAAHADLLVAAGFIEGSRNTHPGQGTSNRRFFFNNTTVEFLYVHDIAETMSGPAKGLRFQDRRTENNASPFGLVIRTVHGKTELPFETWNYCPEYFANDMCFRVGENSDILEETLCICMPNNLPQRKENSTPENAYLNLSQLRLSLPVQSLSKVLLEITKCQNIEIELNKPHCLELTFNDNVQGKRRDFRPEIPLIFNW